jgi:two-component system response regulator AtoC
MRLSRQPSEPGRSRQTAEVNVERVLVVDDEAGIRSFIAEVLEGEGLKVTVAADGEEASRLLDRYGFHLMITDLRMPRVDGVALLAKARNEQPEMEVIVLTAHGTVASAVDAMKRGAFDYLTKPLSGPDELRLAVGRALETRRLREERRRRQPADGHPTFVARDPVSLAMLEQVERVAVTDATVLLTGESGTGKEVLARLVHDRSRRAEGPFVAVNCAALPEALLESEMFGHERGAFTGATTTRRGRFEMADGGSLFLDEVAELQPGLQAKLLRVLQDGRFERIGGSRTLDVDVRVIAATNRELEKEIGEGRFRSDLYHRLAVFPIHLAPLRDRRLDVLPLCEYLLGRIGEQMGRSALALDDRAREQVLEYGWPGNVRELANVLERAAILSGGPVLRAEHLDLGRRSPSAAGTAALPFDGTLRDMEREAIRRALAASGGHRRRTAQQLGIGLRTLYEKIKEFGLE